ncbi:MAG: SWIM zinc finger family protein [Planctomycetaceae bacterium]
MEFNYAYQSSTVVESSGAQTSMSFAPDTLREPTFFRGELKQKLNFREAISALHDVVVSDLRWKPKDKTAYKEWAEKQTDVDMVQVAARQENLKQQIKEIQAELDELNSNFFQRWQPYYKARAKFSRYMWLRDYDARFVLDPVITVHPDEVFFECFSQDESSYGRLSVGYEVFQNVGEFSCGTTNIDYSSTLYDEFQKIRSYKTTQFEIDPGGFEVQTTHEESYKEVKIDLPDSWVRGFLQVSSALSMPAATVELHPLDIHNICLILRRNREILGPRSMRYQLTPGEPVRIVFDPWGTVLDCPRSIYKGDTEQEIRVWGRRRLFILERLIPVAEKFTVQLLGTGMPSFYTAHMGDLTFTLGLSGWTANDWSRSGQFDLLAPRADVDLFTKEKVFNGLKESLYITPDQLAGQLGLDRSVVLGALAAYTQAGRAIWDGNKGVYRLRELTREPLPLERLRFSSEREENASRFLEEQAVQIQSQEVNERGMLELKGTVQDKSKVFEPMVLINRDEQIIDAECTCNWYQQNKLRKGPCEHVLALRMEHARRVAAFNS